MYACMCYMYTSMCIVYVDILFPLHCSIAIFLSLHTYHQVVSEECSEQIQCCCLSLLHLATEHSITAYLEFEQHGGMALVQQVLRTPQASVGELTLKVCR